MNISVNTFLLLEYMKKSFKIFQEAEDKPILRKTTENILIMSTAKLVDFYTQCNPKYKCLKKKPKRVLTKPSQVIYPINDNFNYDYIFTAEDLIVNEKRNLKYYVDDIIGEGTFGQVLLCKNLNGTKLAIKVNKSRPAYANQGKIQAKILRQLNQLTKMLGGPKNCLSIYDAFMWQNHLCMVVQLMDNSLLDILKQSDYEGVSIVWIQKWTKNLLLQLYQIHECGVLHCDLKPQNIMFRPDDPDNPLIIDFSSSCYESSQIYTYIQSRFYRAPEVLIGKKPYTKSIDIWSLGCVLLQLYTGLPIFPGSCVFDQIKKITNILGVPKKQFLDGSLYGYEFFEEKQQITIRSQEQYEKISKKKLNESKSYYKIKKLQDLFPDHNIEKLQLHQLFFDLIKKMLVIDPNQRITAQQAYLHPFSGGFQMDLDLIHEKASQLKKQNQIQTKIKQ